MSNNMTTGGKEAGFAACRRSCKGSSRLRAITYCLECRSVAQSLLETEA